MQEFFYHSGLFGAHFGKSSESVAVQSFSNIWNETIIVSNKSGKDVHEIYVCTTSHYIFWKLHVGRRSINEKREAIFQENKLKYYLKKYFSHSIVREIMLLT